MAQDNIFKKIAAVGGAKVSSQTKSEQNMYSKIKSKIQSVRAGFNNVTLAKDVYTISDGKNVYNTSDTSVPHGPATVDAWLKQIPRSVRRSMTQGQSYGFVTGVTNPFVLAGPEVILPKNEANFNNLVSAVANAVASDILTADNANITNDPYKVSQNNILKTAANSASTSAVSSYAAANNPE